MKQDVFQTKNYLYSIEPKQYFIHGQEILGTDCSKL